MWGFKIIKFGKMKLLLSFAVTSANLSLQSVVAKCKAAIFFGIVNNANFEESVFIRPSKSSVCGNLTSC